MSTSPHLYPDPAALMAVSADQRVFGQPGAGLADAGFSAEATDAGIVGEQRIAQVLDALALDPDMDEARIFHSLRLPGLVADMDHAVLIGNWLILIDAKLWRGADYYQQTREPGDHDGVIIREVRNGITVQERQTLMNVRVQQWQAHLPHLSVFGVVALANDTEARHLPDDPFFVLQNRAQLPSFLNNIARMRTRDTSIADRNALLMMLINPEYVAPQEPVYAPQPPVQVMPGWQAVAPPAPGYAPPHFGTPPLPPYAYGWIILMCIGPFATFVSLIPFVSVVAALIPAIIAAARLRVGRKRGYRGAAMYWLPLVAYGLLFLVSTLAVVLVLTNGFSAESTGASALIALR